MTAWYPPFVAVVAALLASTSCGAPRKRGTSGSIRLAVLPAESDKFPEAAKAFTSSLASADIAGIDDKQVSKVSLEVVQLSIECVEPTVSCYEAVGRSLAADRILFAQITNGGGKKLKVEVTLFDVDARTPRTVKKVYASEQDASAGADALVAELVR